MRVHRTALGLILWLAVGATVSGFDQVKTNRGMIRGRVITITAQEIEIEQSSGGALPKPIPVNEIVSVFFEDEPRQLAEARRAMMDGEFDKAQAELEKLDPKDAKNKNIAVEIEYAKAYCAAKLALSGNGSVVEAGKQMYAFIKAQPKSFHYLEACELEGDLLAANRSYDKAETFYNSLAEAPWPDYKMRAKSALARALLAQNKVAEASRAFDEVLTSDASGPLAEEQRMAAQLGKARCMAASKQAPEAIRIIEGIIAKADDQNVELHARAYNALGTAQRKANKPKEAVLAFLHVHLLYNTVPDADAESLANLAELFTELHRPDRAREARETLQERYKDSPWAAGTK